MDGRAQVELKWERVSAPAEHHRKIDVEKIIYSTRYDPIGDGNEELEEYVALDAPFNPTREAAHWIAATPPSRGLHSSTFRLDVSTFCAIRWVHNFPPVY
jgi:hypothetical protein